MSFYYEFYIHFYLLLISFQVSDMRYKAVRTENTHLKGMMGDLDPSRYMVICWNNSVNSTKLLSWSEFTQMFFTEHFLPGGKLSCTWIGLPFIFRLNIWISGFLPCSFLGLGSVLISSSHMLLLCFALAVASEILHTTWPDSRVNLPLHEAAAETPEWIVPSMLGLYFSLTCFVASHFLTGWWTGTMSY